MVERPLEVRHRDAPVDHDALELREDRQVRRVVLVRAVHAPRGEHVEGQRTLEHRPHLHGRGLGAQHEVTRRRVDVERVLHLASRVVGVDVERVEVEPFVLELGAFRDLPAHPDEDVGDLLLEEGQRMPGPDASPRRDGRDIDAFGLEPRRVSASSNASSRAAKACVTRPRAWPTSLPHSALRDGSTIPQPGVEGCKGRTVRDVRGASGLQFGDGGGVRDRGQRGRDGRVDRVRGDLEWVGHGRRVYRGRNRLSPPGTPAGRRPSRRGTRSRRSRG